MRINLCTTLVEPRSKFVLSKTNDDQVYTIIPSTIFNDPVCSCRGYLFRGRCSHIDHVEANHCMWWTDDLEYQGDCEYCGSPMIIFEMDAEYV